MTDHEIEHRLDPDLVVVEGQTLCRQCGEVLSPEDAETARAEMAHLSAQMGEVLRACKIEAETILRSTSSLKKWGSQWRS